MAGIEHDMRSEADMKNSQTSRAMIAESSPEQNSPWTIGGNRPWARGTLIGNSLWK
jgi:hypothetical protein